MSPEIDAILTESIEFIC